MKKIFVTMILSISFIFLFAMTASAANLITNGSFEEGAYDDSAHPGYMRLSTGSTTITGWVVGDDGLDWHIIEGENAHFGRNGVDGSQYAVDLSRDQESGNYYSISQSFATTAGQDYQLTFLLGAPSFDTGVKVSISNILKDYSLIGSINIWLRLVLKRFNIHSRWFNNHIDIFKY